ncbi:hypothetical protein HPP92_023467 [Vanilla planifolia]|uniref:Response regulatory domain-containing protein n=1 Tax=Vanilla planifolia TaxID=51239 RepID=A0A835PTF0_VANPL|nr:hypothetical protein HPP92_023467 [Vanilla planifolia]
MTHLNVERRENHKLQSRHRLRVESRPPRWRVYVWLVAEGLDLGAVICSEGDDAEDGSAVREHGSSYSSCRADSADVAAVAAMDQFPAGLGVLVVDDDLTCLKILEHMLLKCRYRGESGFDLAGFGFERRMIFALYQISSTIKAYGLANRLPSLSLLSSIDLIRGRLIPNPWLSIAHLREEVPTCEIPLNIVSEIVMILGAKGY